MTRGPVKLYDENGRLVVDGSLSPAPGGGSLPLTDSLTLSAPGSAAGVAKDTTARGKQTINAAITDGTALTLFPLTRVAGKLWSFRTADISATVPASSGLILPGSSTLWGQTTNMPATADAVFLTADESCVAVQLAGSASGGGSDLVTAFADPDGDLDFSHDLSSFGTLQSLWSVELVDPGLPNQSLSYETPDGFLTHFLLATDGGGAITTTAQDIIDLVAAVVEINNSFGASAVGSGAGLVEAFGPTAWPADGDDGSGTAAATVDLSYA